MRLRALRPGRVVVTLRAKITQSMPHPNQYQFDKDLELKDTVEIVIFDDLQLETPAQSSSTNNLLMAVGSEFQLKTNKNEGNDFKVLTGTKVRTANQHLLLYLDTDRFISTVYLSFCQKSSCLMPLHIFLCLCCYCFLHFVWPR